MKLLLQLLLYLLLLVAETDPKCTGSIAGSSQVERHGHGRGEAGVVTGALREPVGELGVWLRLVEYLVLL